MSCKNTLLFYLYPMDLESERLIIRNIKVSDAPFYFELFNDPDWIQFIGDKGLKTIEETEIYLKDSLLKNAQLTGLGYFTVVSKETNKALGVATALQRDSLKFIDIGYGFLPKERGKGYATEAAKLIIAYVRIKFKQEKVHAFTMPKNKASQKLLNNLGFNYIGLQTILDHGEDALFEYIF